jgi:hypothetical protein
MGKTETSSGSSGDCYYFNADESNSSQASSTSTDYSIINRRSFKSNKNKSSISGLLATNFSSSSFIKHHPHHRQTMISSLPLKKRFTYMLNDEKEEAEEEFHRQFKSHSLYRQHRHYQPEYHVPSISLSPPVPNHLHLPCSATPSPNSMASCSSFSASFNSSPSSSPRPTNSFQAATTATAATAATAAVNFNSMHTAAVNNPCFNFNVLTEVAISLGMLYSNQKQQQQSHLHQSQQKQQQLLSAAANYFK